MQDDESGDLHEGQFDKFIDDICQREDTARRKAEVFSTLEETPQQCHQRLYRERWQNRIRWT